MDNSQAMTGLEAGQAITGNRQGLGQGQAGAGDEAGPQRAAFHVLGDQVGVAVALGQLE